MASGNVALGERPVTPGPEEAELLQSLNRLAAPSRSPKNEATAKLIAPDGSTIDLPPSMYEVLRRAAHQLSAGLAVSIVPIGAQLSSQQAADFLGVSRPHVVKLIDAGEIPHTKTGTHRRVLLADVVAYRDRQAGRRSEALEELARLSEGPPLI